MTNGCTSGADVIGPHTVRRHPLAELHTPLPLAVDPRIGKKLSPIGTPVKREGEEEPFEFRLQLHAEVSRDRGGETMSRDGRGRLWWGEERVGTGVVVVAAIGVEAIGAAVRERDTVDVPACRIAWHRCE